MSDWNPEALCPTCGKGPFGNALGWNGHQRSKGHPNYTAQALRPPRAPKVATVPASVLEEAIAGVVAETWPMLVAPTSTEPAIIPTWRSVATIRNGIRSLTMLRPVHRPCELQYEYVKGWWKHCLAAGHDPYVTMIPKPSIERDWEDEIVGGVPTGRRLVVKGTERQVMAYEPHPNVVNISISGRVNGGHGLDNARWKGFIFPSELRSPHYPNGIANTCEFHDCRQQKGLVDYPNTGRFCRREEAAIVSFDNTGQALEVGLGTKQSDDRRREQLAQAVV